MPAMTPELQRLTAFRERYGFPHHSEQFHIEPFDGNWNFDRKEWVVVERGFDFFRVKRAAWAAYNALARHFGAPILIEISPRQPDREDTLCQQ